MPDLDKSTNGKTPTKRVVPLFRADGRTRLGRRVRHVERTLRAAMARELSEAEIEQIRSAAQWSVCVELARDAFAKGQGNADDLVRLENVLRRSLSLLKLAPAEKRAMTLDQYLAAKAKAVTP